MTKENINPSPEMKKHTMEVLTLASELKSYNEEMASLKIEHVVVWKEGYIISIGILHNAFKFLN